MTRPYPSALIAGVRRLCAWSAVAALVAMPAFAQHGAPNGEWPSYGGDTGSTKYAPLDQINRDNVDQLEIAWRWNSPENELVKSDRRLMSMAHESTPLMVNGTLFYHHFA